MLDLNVCLSLVWSHTASPVTLLLNRSLLLFNHVIFVWSQLMLINTMQLPDHYVSMLIVLRIVGSWAPGDQNFGVISHMLVKLN